jgi:hypothetical protein
MWWKFALAGALALIAVFGLNQSQATAQERESHQDRDRRDRIQGLETVRTIRLRNDVNSNLVQIDSVMLVVDERIYGTLTNEGIERDSADKVQFGNLPIIGGLFSSKTPANLRPEQEVGRAYSNGTTLVITIWSRVVDADIKFEILPKEIDALNQTLQDMTNANQPPANAILLPGSVAGGGTVDSLLVANEAFIFELPRTNFQDMGIIKEGESVMIGGLLSETQTQKSGTPLLGKVPVIGYLFQGKTYQRENELVVIVTPSIIRPEE